MGYQLRLLSQHHRLGGALKHQIVMIRRLAQSLSAVEGDLDPAFLDITLGNLILLTTGYMITPLCWLRLTAREDTLFSLNVKG